MSNAVVQVGPVEKLKNGKTLIHASLGGSFGKNEVSLLSEWARSLKEAVKEGSAHQPDSVAALVDIRNLETYSDPQIITILTKLLKDDSPYVYKTATYGGNALHEMIQGVIRSLTERQNIKNFKTEAEAVDWLTQ